MRVRAKIVVHQVFSQALSRTVCEGWRGVSRTICECQRPRKHRSIAQCASAPSAGAPTIAHASEVSATRMGGLGPLSNSSSACWRSGCSAGHGGWSEGCNVVELCPRGHCAKGAKKLFGPIALTARLSHKVRQPRAHERQVSYMLRNACWPVAQCPRDPQRLLYTLHPCNRPGHAAKRQHQQGRVKNATALA